MNNFDLSYNLGHMYFCGIGTTPHLKLAEKFFESIDESNMMYWPAQELLYIIERHSDTLGRSEKKADILFNRILHCGNWVTILSLGRYYTHSHHFPKIKIERDFDKAITLLQMVLDLNSDCSNAFFHLGYIYRFKGELDKTSTFFQIAVDKSCHLNDCIALNTLGRVCFTGTIISRDYHKAIELFQKGIEFEHGPCYSGLAYMNLNGHGLSKNEELAIRLLIQGVDKDDPDSCFLLSYIFDAHGSKEKNYIYAVWLLTKGAKMNDARCIISLADHYKSGNGVRQDFGEAIKLYQKASILGNKKADNKLMELVKHMSYLE